MEILMICIKILAILALCLLMAAPLILEFAAFRGDKDRKISYKRFRILVYSLVYIVAVTVLMYVLKDGLAWLEGQQFVQWLASKLALGSRVVYFGKVLTAMLVNAAIGVVYVLFSKFVRIGLKKKNLVSPAGKDGEFSWVQNVERKVIRFFHSETWFFVARILKWLNSLLSAAYLLLFAVYMVPALFGADWIPYDFIAKLFEAGYLYPIITLLGLWECYFFLEGIKRVTQECPELLDRQAVEMKKAQLDLSAVDAEVRKQFKDYYVCDVDLSGAMKEEIFSSEHHPISKFIGQAVERDQRNPQRTKEVYLDCLDKLVGSDKSLLINGNFFSEFSMYFLRHLSSVVARGDNVVFVCNSESQIQTVYDYILQGLSEQSSLYCKGFRDNAVDYDNPIWRAVKVSGEKSDVDEAAVDDSSILVTSLSYLCSARFENEHSNFITLIDDVVFVDTLETVNTYNRQLAILNTRLKHIARTNAQNIKNGRVEDVFKARYMSRQIRYLCFDDSRTPGLDKVLKNMLAVDFDSADAMNYNPGTIVRCYNYEGRPDEFGRRSCPQYFQSEEEMGAVMNMAVLCLAKGASNVTVFTDDIIPYENIAEAIAANMGRVSIKVDGRKIRLNKQYYNPDAYSVIIAMDSGDNLPATLRRYIAMASDKPALIIVFSRPYMLRDYYLSNISQLWSNRQLERVPFKEGSKRDFAQAMLVKANAGGISRAEILRLAGSVPEFGEFVQNEDINAILRGVLEVYGVPQTDRLNLFQYFVYAASHDFDENGKYVSEDKVLLRRKGKLFDMVNGRDMVTMCTAEADIPLPMPRSRLTQNYIAGQNLLYEGNIYYIQKVDTASGRIYARLAVGGKNDEAYQYIQDREYHLEMDPEQIEHIFPTKHVVLKRRQEDVAVEDVYISVFRVPMEVLTRGYYEVDPHTLALNTAHREYHSIADAGNDLLAKQTYRRYGHISEPVYSSESVMRHTSLNAAGKGALAMSLRLSGQFGPDKDRTAALAAAMLNELLRSMFASVADSIAVCPVLHGEKPEGEALDVLQRQPRIRITGQADMFPAEDLELVILEDCGSDLGVVSILMSAGDDVLSTLFTPILEYLQWYAQAETKSDYLYFGLDHEPECFDFEALGKLAGLLGDDKHDVKFVNIDSLIEYEVCDFCGKRFAKGDNVTQLEDGRRMCKDCAENLVGNNKKILKAHLDRAKIFLESTYGITLDGDCDVCFESTVKIVNTLRQNGYLSNRGADAPLKSYVDERKRVHVEYSIPSANLSELLVRELTHVWQLSHIPDVAEDLAEGHIALVGIQYLRFLNQNTLANMRTGYYESSTGTAGEGYRKLVQQLLANPRFNNNPFRYLLAATGAQDDAVPPPAPRVLEEGELGKPYTPAEPDRALDGNISWFYRSRMTASCQGAYDAILDAARCHRESLIVEGLSFEDVVKVVDCIRYDHPELFAFKNIAMRGNEVLLYYGASAEEEALLQRRMDEVIPKYLEGIDDSMSAYDVAIRIHARVIASVDYDTIALNKQQQEGGPAPDKIDYLRTICGVFLNGKAVCEGYARAMQYLLQKCGIECAEVAGYIHKDNGEQGEGHAWNILKVDGDYYYLDATWDDSSNTIQTVKQNNLGLTYFCITSEELLRTRDLSLTPVDAPMCTATKANYFDHNDLVLENYDLAKVKAIAQDAAANKRKSFSFKCRSRSVFDTAVNQLLVSGQDCGEVIKAAAKQDKQIDTGSYRYTCDKNIQTVTILFKYK